MKPLKITKKYLTKWVNEKLSEMVFSNLTFKDILVVNKNSPPYKGFVPRLVFVFDNGIFPIYVYGYFSMKELQDHIEAGYKLEWKMKGNSKLISESEIGLSKV